MKNLKKMISCMLVAALVGSMLLTGCGKKGGNTDSTGENASQANVEENSSQNEENKSGMSEEELLRRQQLEVIPDDAVYKDASKSVEERVADLMSYMTLKEKAAQMVMAERNTASGGAGPADLQSYPLGSILSGGGSAPASGNTSQDWAKMIDQYQQVATEKTRLGIPILYGIDAVHGNSNLFGVTIFPHNVGLGATGDYELVEKIGAATAKDVRAIGANWIFAPTLGNPQYVTWGRSYECFSEDAKEVAPYGAAYVRGMQGVLGSDEFLSQSKALATAKHYIGEGYTMNGMNQGNVNMSEEEFDELLKSGVIEPFKQAVENGAKTVMISYNSVNGLKCHGNKHLITDILRGELGFDGIVIGDYNAIQQITVPGGKFEDQLLTAIDAGLDVTMEPFMWREITDDIVDFVENGKLSQERLDDSVRRILTAKFELGLFENPYSNADYIKETGSDESRELARQAVRESLVLLKNDKVAADKNVFDVLKNAENIFVAGKGANDIGTQCGGWTISWQGQTGKCTIGTTILDGIKEVTGKDAVYSRDGKDMPENTDIAIVAVSEIPYAESNGDRTYKSLQFMNSEWKVVEAIKEQNPDVPVLVILITGRTLVMDKYIDNADAIVCAWLPGTECEGIADVLFGDYDFTGKLNYTWFKTGDDYKKRNEDGVLYEKGFGLKKAD